MDNILRFYWPIFLPFSLPLTQGTGPIMPLLLTVRKYWDMPPDEYVKAAENIRKSHVLGKYEPVILN